MKTSKLKWIIGIVICAIVLVLISVLSVQDNLVYFYTPVEAQAQAATLSDKRIRIGGMVLNDSVVKNPETLDIKFTLSDLQESNIEVYYKGSPPDLFKAGSGVVAEGRLSADGKELKAYKLMVKHSEEYKKPDESHSIDKQLLEHSILKD